MKITVAGYQGEGKPVIATLIYNLLKNELGLPVYLDDKDYIKDPEALKRYIEILQTRSNIFNKSVSIDIVDIYPISTVRSLKTKAKTKV